MIKGTLFIIAMTASLAAHSAVYQCKKDGQTVFSDTPCGADAKKLKERTAAMTGGSMGGDRSREFLDHRSQKSDLSKIDRRIERLRREKAEVQQIRDASLVEYQKKKARANNNLAGAVWENSLAQEADVLRERYQSEIDDIDRDIDRLLDERQQVANN